MARVLQIRRGTTTQNDNFTGMPGELSFDTDAKTLRVHDGQTLGGFELARRDDVSGNNDANPAFDINSVPDEFWHEKFSQFAATPITILASRPMPVNTNSYLEYVFETDATPMFVQTTLICDTPQAGYSIGDEVAAFGIDNRTNPSPFTFIDDEGLHVRLMTDHKDYWVSHHDTGATTVITPANWKIKFRVYCCN